MVASASGSPPLLKIENLQTYLFLRRGVVRAVDGVNLEMHAGETLGLVGESGSGKTMTSLSILRMLPKPGGRIVIEELDVRSFGIKLVALAEKLALMRSHFLSPTQISAMFCSDHVHVHVVADGSTAWIVVDKENIRI